MEIFEYIWDTLSSTILVLCLLYVFLPLFLWKKVFKNTTQRSTLRQDGCAWQDVWEDMGRYHLQWAWKLPLNNCRILKYWQNVSRRYALILAMPTTYHLHCAEVWPVPTKHWWLTYMTDLEKVNHILYSLPRKTIIDWKKGVYILYKVYVCRYCPCFSCNSSFSSQSPVWCCFTFRSKNNHDNASVC